VKVEASIRQGPLEAEALGAFLGRSRSWKKAIVTLAAGERIKFFEGASA